MHVHIYHHVFNTFSRSCTVSSLTALSYTRILNWLFSYFRNYFRNYTVYIVLKGVISTHRCPQYHMDIGQAYKRNEGEGLGIEFIIEFTGVQNSNHKCSWQQNMCGKLSVACVEYQLWLWTGYLTICTGMWVAIKYFKIIGLPYCTITTLSSVTRHDWPWIEPPKHFVMCHDRPWTLTYSRLDVLLGLPAHLG